MERESIEYKDWKTGKDKIYRLNDGKKESYEQKTELLCPLDDTPIIFESGVFLRRYFCPNCDMNYVQGSNQEDIFRQAKKISKNYLQRLNNLLIEERNLVEKITLAKKKGLLEEEVEFQNTNFSQNSSNFINNSKKA